MPHTDGDNNINELGIVSGHAYGILDLQKIKDNTKKEQYLIKLRNPWGREEWKGDWSD